MAFDYANGADACHHGGGFDNPVTHVRLSLREQLAPIENPASLRRPGDVRHFVQTSEDWHSRNSALHEMPDGLRVPCAWCKSREGDTEKAELGINGPTPYPVPSVSDSASAMARLVGEIRIKS